MAREIRPWFFSLGSSAASTSSDAADVVKNLEGLEAKLQEGKAWLDGVEAEVFADAQTDIEKKEIKEWCYEAEDLLDERKFEELGAEVESPNLYRKRARDSVTDLLTDPSFQRRVDDLKQGWEEFWEYYRMRRPPGAWGQESDLQLPATSSIRVSAEGEIYGRDEDKKLLVKFLLGGATEERLSVFPIVGATGVGKTTLVQHIYDGAEVSAHFQWKGWTSAPRGWGMMELMNAIAESLTGVPCNYNQLEAVQDLLKQKIDGKRFLLVLDDVWYETIEGNLWKELCATLSRCKAGSVVILTTQDVKVADRTRTVRSHILQPLSDDCCWLVFRKHAFSGFLSTGDGRLIEIGKKIAKECQGSPLVAKALGIELRDEHDVTKWEEFFSRRDTWHEVVPELRSGYHRLPAHLRRCFVYCSMFPRESIFSREQLVLLWMAQGFIKEENGRQLEDVGIGYFDDFCIRSFFQQSKPDSRVFQMLNLLRALAQSISDGECLATEDCNLANLQNLYHLFFTPSGSQLSIQSLSLLTHLRSFLVCPPWPPQSIARVSLSEAALRSMDRLRALDVRYTNMTNLLDAIGNLKHLRYLSLQGTNIRDVPPSVFKLYNLQALDLSNTRIEELPDLLQNLKLLSFLYLRHTRIERLPAYIWKLRFLRTLAWNRMGALQVSKK